MTRARAAMLAMVLAGCGTAPQVGKVVGPGVLDEPVATSSGPGAGATASDAGTSPSPGPSPTPAPGPHTAMAPTEPDPAPAGDEVIVAAEDPVMIERVCFKPGSATLDAAGVTVLKAVADVMRAHPEVELLEVQGHVAAGERGAKLDQSRADNARRYLVTQGVAPERLMARGYGATRPLDTAATDAARARNRRVDFTVAVRVAPAP